MLLVGSFFQNTMTMLAVVSVQCLLAFCQQRQQILKLCEAKTKTKSYIDGARWRRMKSTKEKIPVWIPQGPLRFPRASAAHTLNTITSFL